MDMESAIASATAPRDMSLDDLDDHIAATHGDNVQRLTLAQLALGRLRGAIAELAALGHNFGIHLGAALAPEQFPQMLYKDSPGAGLVQMTVHSSEDRSTALADGWRDHPSLESASRPPSAPLDVYSGGSAGGRFASSEAHQAWMASLGTYSPPVR